MAGSVISWKTIRRTGTLGLSVSSRCQAMASPSRSWSVASSSSSADFSASRELGDLALLLRGDDVERREVVVDVDARAGPTARPCTWPARRRRRAAGRGCARPRPRRRSPCPGTGRSSWPWWTTRRSPGGGSAVAARGRSGRAGAPAAAGLPAARVGLGGRARRSGCHLVLLHRRQLSTARSHGRARSATAGRASRNPSEYACRSRRVYPNLTFAQSSDAPHPPHV